jgi:hypothetical protein
VIWKLYFVYIALGFSNCTLRLLLELRVLTDKVDSEVKDWRIDVLTYWRNVICALGGNDLDIGTSGVWLMGICRMQTAVHLYGVLLVRQVEGDVAYSLFTVENMSYRWLLCWQTLYNTHDTFGRYWRMSFVCCMMYFSKVFLRAPYPCHISSRCSANFSSFYSYVRDMFIIPDFIGRSSLAHIFLEHSWHEICYLRRVASLFHLLYRSRWKIPFLFWFSCRNLALVLRFWFTF